MKTAVIFSLIFLSAACLRQSQNTETLPVVQTPPTPFETVELPVNSSPFPSPENSGYDIKKAVAADSKKLGLPILEKRQMLKEDLEIRVWREFGLAFKKSIFILRRSNKNWSAFFVEKTSEDSAEGKTSKTTKLKEPKSGWENVWRKLVDEEILTLPNGAEIGIEPYPDNWYFTVETKVGGNYRVYDYPEGYQEIREARQMAKIAQIIADEFALQDFQPAQ